MREPRPVALANHASRISPKPSVSQRDCHCAELFCGGAMLEVNTNTDH